ncbi:MAG: hypothetical protein FGM54_01160 [Chitinophagaceae bacterium]|nr:hypothetical protein [Chitinophagaceae bacterium]
MKFNELVAISGLSGLYQLVSTKSDGAIVRSLEDKSTKFVAARSHNVTPLDSIEVFTKEDNLRLWDVFQIFKKNEAQVGDVQVQGLDNKAIKMNFEKLFPEYDRDRVYISDMKKMMKWYGILKSYNLLDEVEMPASEESEN